MRYPILLILLTAFVTREGQAQFATPVAGPGPVGDSDNVDFADVDLDGDWDVAIARGGEDTPQQNRLWINQGGVQAGVLGAFVDASALRFPNINDATRDVEFGDIDADGDPDLYLAGNSTVVNQASKWWVNQGGEQGGSPGFFADETAERWLGLGQSGSSISPALLIGGGFIDWSGDGDFADLDNDGDLDLVHTSYGGSFAGQVPSRLFLNDGTGRFEEFNPTGFQLTGANLEAGDPALWCEGRQTPNTLDVSGAGADIAGSVLDVELADLDGDFDVDFTINNLQEAPRQFRNRLEELGGQLSFRDVTGTQLPSGSATDFANYEHELGDMDGDGDLDLYGLNWSGFDDRTLANDGTGAFSIFQDPVPASGADDNEADWLDYDSDGDLDVFVANWSGQDKLYANDGSGVLSLVQQVPLVVTTSLDADAADVDGDGDPDVVIGTLSQADQVLTNLTDVADGIASSIPLVEDPGDRVAAVESVPVRAHVLGNAPLYVTAWDRTELAVAVQGFELGPIPARWSGGQVFRGELPGNLVGAVAFRARSFDEYENEGVSAVVNYEATSPLPFDQPYGNATPGLGGVPSLRSLAVPFPGAAYLAGADGFTPGALTVTLLATQALDTPLVVPGLGAEIWIGGAVAAEQTRFADGEGRVVFDLVLPEAVPSGVTVALQSFGIDGAGGGLLSATPGLRWTTQ